MAVTDEAIEKIKAMIVSGTLRAGDRLPKEADLAAELGLSRSSLREAVRALSLMNILDVRQGDGTYVTSLEPTLLLEALSFIVDFHRDATVLELLAVRRILEPAATAMAAERATDAELEELGKLLDSFGPDRLMFGSDWPVCLLAASYDEVFGLARALLTGLLSQSELDAVFGTNAIGVYGLEHLG